MYNERPRHSPSATRSHLWPSTLMPHTHMEPTLALCFKAPQSPAAEPQHMACRATTFGVPSYNTRRDTRYGVPSHNIWRAKPQHMVCRATIHSVPQGMGCRATTYGVPQGLACQACVTPAEAPPSVATAKVMGPKLRSSAHQPSPMEDHHAHLAHMTLVRLAPICSHRKSYGLKALAKDKPLQPHGKPACTPGLLGARRAAPSTCHYQAVPTWSDMWTRFSLIQPQNKKNTRQSPPQPGPGQACRWPHHRIAACAPGPLEARQAAPIRLLLQLRHHARCPVHHGTLRCAAHAPGQAPAACHRQQCCQLCTHTHMCTHMRQWEDNLRLCLLYGRQWKRKGSTVYGNHCKERQGMPCTVGTEGAPWNCARNIAAVA